MNLNQMKKTALKHAAKVGIRRSDKIIPGLLSKITRSIKSGVYHSEEGYIAASHLISLVEELTNKYYNHVVYYQGGVPVEEIDALNMKITEILMGLIVLSPRVPQ